jgi:ketosteroid isomerase-like protein
MAEVWREWLGAWGRFKSEAEAFRELSDGRVLVLVRGHGRSKTSTVEVVDRSANVFDIRGGRVTRLTIFNSRDRALADLGLEEQAMPKKPTTPDLEEISRKNYEALNRGDIDAAMSVFRPDAVFDGSALGLGTYEGLAAIRVRFEEWMGSFEDFEVVVEEFRDLGNGVTLTVSLQKGRSLGSIGSVERRPATIGIWTEGLIERVAFYADPEEARAAAERLARERG